MRRFDVAALGELLIDFTENGTGAQGNPLLEANPGGAPCNVLAMLQRLGRKTAFIGKVGADHFGEFLRGIVEEQGIDTANLSQDTSVHTTLAFVHTGEGGERSFSFYRNPGADMMLRDSDYDKAVLQEAKIFHFGTLSMTDAAVAETTKEAVRLAKENGAVISFDPNLRPTLWGDLADAAEAMWYGISQCDVLKIADNEIEFLTGEKDIDAGIAKILERFKPALVCATLGPDGSIAYHDGKRVFCPPFLTDKTIETTGAGDTFMACVLNAVLEKLGERAGGECSGEVTDGAKRAVMFSEDELGAMLRFANAAASIITTRRGALRVMPTCAEVEELLGR